jgi:hypothetical protein
MTVNETLTENYRTYPGNRWTEIANQVLDYLLQCGLQETHTLVDVGCGPLRIGKQLITFLGSQCYTGIEPEASMLDAGIAHEVSGELLKLKRPRFIREPIGGVRVNAGWALGWDVFNHLSASQLELALNTITANKWLMNVHIGESPEVIEKTPRGWSYRHADTQGWVYTQREFDALTQAAGFSVQVLDVINSVWEDHPFTVALLRRDMT